MFFALTKGSARRQSESMPFQSVLDGTGPEAESALNIHSTATSASQGSGHETGSCTQCS